MHSNDSQELGTNIVSSQSMLLDHDESALANDSWMRSPDRLSLQRNFGHAPPDLERTLSPSPQASQKEDLDSARHNTAGPTGRDQFASPSLEHDVALFSERSVTQSPVPFDSPSPMWRHLPMDDKPIAEQTDIAQPCIEPSNLQQPHSPIRLFNASSPLVKSETSSYPAVSSWLTHTRPFGSPNAGRSRAPAVKRSALIVSSHPKPSISVTEIEHSSPIARVFGQLIQIRSDDGVNSQ